MHWIILIFCDRKKVGNFIAGNDTSQSAQAEQQGSYANGKHTPLPVDQYLFLGMKYDIHFLTVDVTTFGKSKYKLLQVLFSFTLFHLSQYIWVTGQT